MGIHSWAGHASDSAMFWAGMVVLWSFSAAVGAMSSPAARDSRWYPYVYRFLHLLAANLDRAGVLPIATDAKE